MAGFRDGSSLERSDCVAYRGLVESKASDAWSHCHDVYVDWLGGLGFLLRYDHAFDVARVQTLLVEIGKHWYSNRASVLVLFYSAIYTAR